LADGHRAKLTSTAGFFVEAEHREQISTHGEAMAARRGHLWRAILATSTVSLTAHVVNK
jgi:hypothetical protein